MNKDIKIKSLAKALSVLDCFIKQPEWGVTEISEELSLNKSNACDILTTFQACGYIDQNTGTGKYRLGYHVLELAQSLSSSLDFHRIVYPHMKQLADKVGETIYLGVPDGFDVIYLDAAYPGQETMTRTVLGARAPMYCTGIGKAILSSMAESDWEEVAQKPLEKITDATITTKEKLMQEMVVTRNRGYSVDNMEHEYGIRCVGVPIKNARGNVFAALSITGPSLRFTEEKIKCFAEGLKHIAEIVGVYC